MGGTPLTALQLLSWPRDELPWSVAADVIDGAVEVLTEAGCTLVGGHSIDDTTPKFGFAITGTVHPDRIITNDAAQPGDRLILTKALGTGLIATAIKNGAASAVVQDAAIASMTRLNASASRAAVDAGVRAGTDVTGFGLLGHLAEMLRASGVSAVLDASAVPVLEGVAEIVADGPCSRRHETQLPIGQGLRRLRRHPPVDAHAAGGRANERGALARRPRVGSPGPRRGTCCSRAISPQSSVTSSPPSRHLHDRAFAEKSDTLSASSAC